MLLAIIKSLSNICWNHNQRKIYGQDLELLHEHESGMENNELLEDEYANTANKIRVKG